MKRKAVTVSTVNSAIARAGIKAELVRGNGYHYFQGREVIHRHPGPGIHRGHQEPDMCRAAGDAPTLGERLAPGCSCGHSIESNRCTCN